MAWGQTTTVSEYRTVLFDYRTTVPYASRMAEGSKTVDQALRMLVAMRDHGPGTASELGRRIGISRSAAGRILTSLEGHRFARRTPEGYDLGFDLLQFSAELGSGIRTAALPHLETLADRFDETAVLAARDGDDAVALDQVVAHGRVVSIQYGPGTRHPLSLGAHGLAMLADARLQPQDFDPNLLPRLAEVARIGYAVSRDELEPGVTGVAAPIVSGTGAPIAAVGVVGPSVRFPEIGTVAAAVTQAAESISAELSGAAPVPTSRT